MAKDSNPAMSGCERKPDMVQPSKQMKSTMRRDERGIALIIVLFATLLLTVIGLGMMYSTNMETSINGNYRDSQVALYGALSGLQQGRERIKYPYDITPPTVLPSTTSANIIYIVSDSSTVKPWLSTNPYFDTELCQEKVLDLDGTPGVPCTETATGSSWYQVVNNASSSTWNLASSLSWKWTRIQLKANNNTPVPVNGDPDDSSQACWSGTTQMSTPTAYTTGCQPVGGVNAVDIDAPGTGYASPPTITLTGGGGTGATATASMAAETTGYVMSIAVDNGGSYASTPTVTLSGNGTATAVLSGTGSTVVTGGSVTSATLSAGGTGYTSSPTVTISGGGGTGATGVASLSTTGSTIVTGGSVTSTSVSSGGTGYTSAPAVTFSGGAGSGATGIAVMVSDGTGGVITGGTVTATTLTAGGAGYTSPPSVVFSGGGGGTGASATAVLSSSGTTVVTGSVTTISLSSGGSNYTSTPTVTLTGGGGTGATATATRGSTGPVSSIALGSVGTQCYLTASNAVITFSGGGGSGAAASAVLDTTRSCIYSVAVNSPPKCTAKLDTSTPGYTHASLTAPNLTLAAGNYSFRGSLLVGSDDKGPVSVSVQNPGYDTTSYNGGGTVATNFRLTAGAAWADCGNITATATTGYRIASINLTSTGSGYTSAPTVTITGGTGSTSNPTATAAVGFPITGLTLTSGGSGYSTAPTVGFSGGGGSGAAGTTTVVSSSTTTYPVAAINLVSGGTGYIITPTIALTGGGGSGATGTATVVTTGTTTYMVQSINITGGGTGYTSAPSVSFSSGGGSGAAATAGVSTTSSTTYPVASVTITSAGTGYTSTPTITLSGGSGSGATATANVTFTTATTYPVASVTVNSGGTGYTAAPTVTFTGGGGSGGAAATATIGTMNTGTFAIDHIDVSTMGSGYSSNPAVTFSGGGGSGAAATAQISGGTKYGKVWLLTSLAVTPTGARSMVQMEVASPVLGFGSGGALTLDGPNPLIDAMPNSNNFVIRGNDANSCSQTAEVLHPAISGFDDPNASPPTSSVETIIDSLPRPDHYTGAGGTPSVQNGFASIGETMSTPDGMDSVMSAIYNTPGAHHYTTANVGTFSTAATTANSINYIDADLTLHGNGTGRGVLVVTGTLHMSGNFSWYGIIFVVGDGIVEMNGGGNGQIQGSLWVAKTWDSRATKNLLNTMGSPSFHWNGGGGNGIQYDHCYVTNLLNAVNLSSVNSTRPLKALSYRALAY